MLVFDSFTKEERTIIGEFVFSYEHNILIKDDTNKLITLLLDKKIIDTEEYNNYRKNIKEDSNSISEEIMVTLLNAVNHVEGKKIMDEYFGVQ